MEFLASAPPPIIKPNIYNVDPKNATLVPLNIAIRIFVKPKSVCDQYDYIISLNKKNGHKADLLTHWIMVIKDEWGNVDLKKIINREWKTGEVPKVLLQQIEPYNSANVIVTINDSQIECDSVSSSNNIESTNLGEEGGGEVADQSIRVGGELVLTNNNNNLPKEEFADFNITKNVNDEVLGFNHNDNNYPEKVAIDGIEIVNPNDPTTRAINNNDTRPNNTINHTFQWNCDYGNDVSITGTFEEGLIVSANDVVYNDDIRQSSNLQSHAALIYKELQGELETRQLIYEIDSKLHISEAPKGKDKKRGQKLKAYKQQLLNHSIRLQDGEKRIILHKFEKILDGWKIVVDIKSYYDELSSSFLLSSSDYINI
nr:2895_t:CDS:2 [Entrophospora candida]